MRAWTRTGARAGAMVAVLATGDLGTRAAPLDYEADYCAVRIYDAAHLARIPGQTVTRISFGGLRQWNIKTGRDLPYREPRGALAVTAAGRASPVVPITCTDYAEDQAKPVEDAYYCKSPCGTGQLIITFKGTDLRIASDGFTAQCGLPSLDGKDDKVFLLRAAALSSCAIPDGWPRTEDGFHDLWLATKPR